MKVSKLFPLATALVALFLVYSCVTTQPRVKLLVGTWAPVKAVPYAKALKANSLAVTVGKPADTSAAAKEQKNEISMKATVIDEKKNKDLERIIQQQMRTTMKLNADNTCEISMPGRTINAVWKLKKKGSLLYIKDPETGHKGNLELLSLNDTSAMGVQKTNAGDILIRYRKK